MFLSRRHSVLRAFPQCQKGASAIEFAIVFPVFLLAFLSTIELGLIYYTTSVVNTISGQVTRFSKTGYDYSEGMNYSVSAGEDQAFNGQTGDAHFTVDQNGNVNLRGREGYIREWLRNSGKGILDPDKLRLQTRLYDDITLANYAGTQATAYNMGDSGQAVAYIVTYEWKVLCPLLMPFLGSTYVIESATVGQNEFF